MAFGSPAADRRRAGMFHKQREAELVENVRKCDICGAASVARVPGGGVEWVCQPHAEEFWRGVVLTAAAMREQQRAVDAEIETEFYDQEATTRALREANLVAHCYDMTSVRWTPCP